MSEFKVGDRVRVNVKSLTQRHVNCRSHVGSIGRVERLPGSYPSVVGDYANYLGLRFDGNTEGWWWFHPAGLDPIAPEKADAGGWVSLPALPAGPMLVEIERQADSGEILRCWSEFADYFGCCSGSPATAAVARSQWGMSYENILRWRPAQEAQKAEVPKPEHHKGVPRESLPEIIARKRKELEAAGIDFNPGIHPSDRAGIDAFTAPPEREPSPVKPPRVSSRTADWRWLEGWQ